MQLLCSFLFQVAVLFTLFLPLIVRLLLFFSLPNAFSVPFSVLLLELVLQVAAPQSQVLTCSAHATIHHLQEVKV
jgi:hypothetical protein